MLRGSIIALFLFTVRLTHGGPVTANVSILVLPEPGEFEEQAAALECYRHRHHYGLVFLDIDAPHVTCGVYSSLLARCAVCLGLCTKFGLSGMDAQLKGV